MIVRAYAEAYLDDVVENQGKLFDLVAQQYPDKDTEEFINTFNLSHALNSHRFFHHCQFPVIVSITF